MRKTEICYKKIHRLNYILENNVDTKSKMDASAFKQLLLRAYVQYKDGVMSLNEFITWVITMPEI